MFIRAYMPDSPESCTLLKQAGLLRQDVLPEQLEMIALAQEVSTRLGLDQLTIEVNRVLNGFVLDRKDLDSLHDLIEEELSENIVGRATHTLLPREAEVNAIFHDEETLLALRPLQSLEQGTINLRHGPAFKLARTTFLINKGVAKFGAYRDISVAQLLEAHLVHFAMVFDQLADNLELIVGADVKVGLHALNDWL